MLSPHSTTPTLLLIENSEDHAVLFQRIFAKVAQHWALVWVRDGSTAVHKMVSGRLPDLLVTSLDIPRVEATEVIEWVRTIKSERPIPVLIFDAIPNPELHRQLLELNVEAYLDKRSPSEKFRQVLSRMVAEVEMASSSLAPRDKSMTPPDSRKRFRVKISAGVQVKS